MSKLVLKPKAQHKLMGIVDKFELAIGNNVTDYKTSMVLIEKAAELGNLIAQAKIDAKSIHDLPFIITARTYHTDWYVAMSNADRMRLPTISQMRQILECYDHPISKNVYWVSCCVADDKNGLESFAFRVKNNSYEIISNEKSTLYTYFYIKDR